MDVFFARYGSLIITHEKMYFLRKRSLYFSQIRDSITPSSILRASYVFFPQKQPIPFSQEWCSRAVLRASYVFFPTEIADAPLLGLVLPCRSQGELYCLPAELADALIPGVVFPCRSQGELCFFPTETADAPLLGVVLPCRSQGELCFSPQK